MSEPPSLFRAITTFVLDVDGVLTDGTIQVNESGDLLRTMSIVDGFALKSALRAGYRIAVITGGDSAGVRRRFAKLGLVDYYSGVVDKAEVLAAYAERHAVDLSRALYMADDLPDVPPMQYVGLPCAPADARPEVLAVARYVSPHRGGAGCVRDVIERVMKLNGQWPPT